MAIEAQLYSENLGFPMFGSQSQNLMVDNNGCGGSGGGFNQFCFNVQQKPPQLLQYQPPPMNPGVLVPALHNNNIMAYTRQSIAAQEVKQRQEIDDYLRLQQNERLRLVLQEQRKQQLALLMKKIESRTELLLKQKDEEIAQALKKRMELEDFLRKLEAENQAWQRVAQENEAMVMSLNNTLEQFRERAACGAMEDAESCCDSKQEEEEEDTGDYRGGFNNGVNEEIKMMVCKGCNSKRSCVLFLPCRHLCSCKACEAGFDACPVCTTPKRASIEALIF
ncbi:probable BOI-related E3 ubiquitin-protein ligase 2 isoform X1 [Rosa rugosa]|uniref:probable BOI-related E3 ubiquitin-protein ligase 2 isoform X1 n=1 Tax=Rosa rugosa TaxID=74645 RepID=UPI002B411E9A|nr:probable BOI-related E3 ubiquitin-protein ligase 2 isoform X1 [Rosa rugosa]